MHAVEGLREDHSTPLALFLRLGSPIPQRRHGDNRSGLLQDVVGQSVHLFPTVQAGFGFLEMSARCTLWKVCVRIIVPHLHCVCAWDLQFLRDDMVTIVPACCKMLSASRSICSQQFRQVSDSWRCRHGARCGSFA